MEKLMEKKFLKLEVSNSAVNAETRYVELEGRKIAYRAIGKGDPFILCNRFRGTLDTWDPAFLDSLAGNFTVITFDYSGFGLSTGTPPTAIVSFADDVRELITSFGFEKVLLGGWSFGGIVAQVAITEFPDLISHGILLGTGPAGKNDSAIEPIFFEKSRIVNNSLEDEMVLFFEPAWAPSREAAIRSHERISQRTKDLDVPVPPALWDNYTKGFIEFVEDKRGVRDKLMISKIPTLVISGDHDISFPVQNWYALVRKLQTTQIIVIPMAGHGPQHEFPELVAQYVGTFINNIH
jgi:pimeloyl-ACP methyl ester carboxylesterase